MTSPRLFDVFVPNTGAGIPAYKANVRTGTALKSAYAKGDHFAREYWLSPLIMLTRSTPYSVLNEFCSRHGFRLSELGGDDKREAMFRYLSSATWPEGYDNYMLARHRKTTSIRSPPEPLRPHSPRTPRPSSASAGYSRPGRRLSSEGRRFSSEGSVDADQEMAWATHQGPDYESKRRMGGRAPVSASPRPSSARLSRTSPRDSWRDYEEVTIQDIDVRHAVRVCVACVA